MFFFLPILCSFTANAQAMVRDVAVSIDSRGVVMYSAMAKLRSVYSIVGSKSLVCGVDGLHMCTCVFLSICVC